MKFNVSAADLLDVCKEVKRVISENTVLPVLRCFLMDLKDGRLEIIGNNLESGMRTSLEVSGEGSGKAAVPAKVFLDFLRRVKDEQLSVELDPSHFSLNIKTGTGNYKVTGDNPEEFPLLPEMEGGNQVVLPAHLLKHFIETTLFAASKDEETNRALAGVHIEFEDQGINFVATDAHRLILYSTKEVPGITASFNPNAFTLPRKAATILKDVLPADEETQVTLTFNDKYAFFQFGDTLFYSQLIDAAFPNYKQIIPDSYPNYLVVNRDLLLTALQRVSLFANRTTQAVVFELNTEPKLIAEDIDFSNRGEEKLMATYQGEPMNVTFNAPFLEEAIKNFPSDELRIEFASVDHPVMIYPAQEIENRKALMLIMPIGA
ncbi:MAG: DNA polymerase III subunit beta [Chlorobi bacterium]|nr:DNA polymerase III subunit beta [Chlorobiota bacterium]